LKILEKKQDLKLSVPASQQVWLLHTLKFDWNCLTNKQRRSAPRYHFFTPTYSLLFSKAHSLFVPSLFPSYIQFVKSQPYSAASTWCELFQSCCVVSVTAWLQFDDMYYIINILINQRWMLLALIIPAQTCAVAGPHWPGAYWKSSRSGPCPRLFSNTAI